MSISEVDNKVKQLRDLRSLEAEIRAEISAVEDSLKAAMLLRKTDALAGQEYTVTWRTIVTTRFDSRNFKLTHADLYAQYSRPSTSHRLVIA